MNLSTLGQALVSALAFSLLGVIVFAFAFWLITKVTPFSIRKEIEADQNTALAIMISAVILGISLIIAAAIHA